MPDPARTAAAARRLAPVIRLAPAKLNLTLAVLGRRPDGYHELHSVMVPLALADRLSVARAAAGHDTLRVDGLDAGPVGDNLVLRAIAATRAAVGRAADPFPLAARLEKRIPVAAGLAGGSSDAAAAIDGALEAWGLRVRACRRTARSRRSARRSRPASARTCRSSSPAAQRSSRAAASASSRSPRSSGTAPGVLLVTPAVAASTPAVFAAYDGGGAAAPADPRATRLTSEHLAAELRAGLSAASLVARAGVLASANDLAAAAGIVVPGLASLRRALARRLGRPVGVSGSGPTLWVLYPSAGGGGDGRRPRSATASPAAPSSHRGIGPPFVIASSIARRPRGRGHEPGYGTRSGGTDMTRQAVSTSSAPAAIGPYSQGIASGDLVFCSGQLGLDPATGELVEGVEAQAERALRNLAAVLDAAGCSWGDVVKTTIYLADIGDFGAVNGVYARFMPDPPPARSTFAVGALPKGGLVEIEADRAAPRLIDRAARAAGGRPRVRRRRLTPPALRPYPFATRMTPSPPVPPGRTAAIILAAGLGTRMKSRTPKVLHPLCGRPMLAFVLDAWADVTPDSPASLAPVVVYSPAVAAIRDAGSATGSASRSRTSRAAPPTRFAPGWRRSPTDVARDPRPVRRRAARAGGAPRGDPRAAPPGRRRDRPGERLRRVDPGSLGRVVRSEFGSVERIVEAKDASPDELESNEINAGCYAFDAAWLRRRIGSIEPSATTGELYLTELVRLAREDGRIVSAVGFDDDGTFDGINDRAQLAQAEWALRVRRNEAHMRAGVTMRDPSTVYLDWGVELAADVTLEPERHPPGRDRRSARAARSVRAPRSSTPSIGSDCTVWASVRRALRRRGRRRDRAVQPPPPGHARRARAPRSATSPSSRTRRLGAGVKQHHVSYLGDAELGDRTNVGAGTITANWDGRTQAPDDDRRRTPSSAWTRCSSPRSRSATARRTGAGAVVTKTVPAGKLAVGVPARIREPRGRPAAADGAGDR